MRYRTHYKIVQKFEKFPKIKLKLAINLMIQVNQGGFFLTYGEVVRIEKEEKTLIEMELVWILIPLK